MTIWELQRKEDKDLGSKTEEDESRKSIVKGKKKNIKSTIISEIDTLI